MQILTEVLRGATAAGLVVVAFTALRAWKRDREHANIALTVALGLLAFASVSGRVNLILGYEYSVVGDLMLAAFGASGYALVSYRSAVVRRNGRWRAVALVATVAAATAVLAVRYPTDPAVGASAVQLSAVNALALVWMVLVLESAVRFFVASRSPPPVSAGRFRLLGAGYVGLVAALGVSLVGGGKGRPLLLAVVVQASVLGLVALLYLGVAPPLRLRRRWLRRASEMQAAQIAAVGAWYWEAAGDLVVLSDELHEIFGTESTFEGSHTELLGFVHPEDRARVAELICGCFTSGERFDIDHRIVRADGEVRWVHGSGVTVCDPVSGRAVAMLGTGVEITERKLAELATEQALAKEREALDRLKALDRMKDAFLAAVSHELRTPLTAVLPMGALLDRDELAADPRRVKHFSRRIVANARRLDRLVSDLLDLDRITRATLEPVRVPARLDALVRRVVDQIADGGHPITVDTDEVEIAIGVPQVERIVESLVVNAIRHTPDGTPVWVRVQRTEGGAELLVSDAGPGVGDQHKQRIFEPFTRGDSTVARARGSGIGLSLVARFAELHAGRAWVTDRPGGGACFHVLLPRSEPDVPEISSPSERSSVR